MNICARIIQLINSRLFALVSTPTAGTHVFLVDSAGRAISARCWRPDADFTMPSNRNLARVADSCPSHLPQPHQAFRAACVLTRWSESTLSLPIATTRSRLATTQQTSVTNVLHGARGLSQPLIDIHKELLVAYGKAAGDEHAHSIVGSPDTVRADIDAHIMEMIVSDAYDQAKRLRPLELIADVEGIAR